MSDKNKYLKRQEEDVLSCNLCGYKFCMHFCPVYDLTKSEASFSTGLNHYAWGVLKGLVDYTSSAVEQIYKCTLCGSCRDARCVAPSMGESVDTPKIIQAMRSDIVAQGKAPERMIRWGEIVRSSHNVYNKPRKERFNWAPGYLLSKEKADLVYFAGCVSSYLHTEIPKAVIKILSGLDIDFALMKEEACCGLPMLESGQRDIAEELAISNLKSIKKMGAKKVLFSCPSCFKAFDEYAEEFGLTLDFEPVFIVDYLEELINRGRLKLTKKIKEKVTYHDPCHLGGKIKKYDSPRRLINLVPGLELVEMERSKELRRCCGAGGQVKKLFPELSMRLAEKRIEDVLSTGAHDLVTCCPSCKENLKDFAGKNSSGSKVYDITEIIVKAI
jgi:heterodisulfide reductase subunit D